jgi:hypothetical protein
VSNPSSNLSLSQLKHLGRGASSTLMQEIAQGYVQISPPVFQSNL